MSWLTSSVAAIEPRETYSPQSKSRERPQRSPSSAAASGHRAFSAVSSPGHGKRERVQLDRRLAVEGLLDPSLLLGLEQRMILERILDLVAIERHLAVEIGVLLLQLEVILDHACER